MGKSCLLPWKKYLSSHAFSSHHCKKILSWCLALNAITDQTSYRIISWKKNRRGVKKEVKELVTTLEEDGLEENSDFFWRKEDCIIHRLRCWSFQTCIQNSPTDCIYKFRLRLKQ